MTLRPTPRSDQAERPLRLHRTLLLCGAVAYLGWWLFVRLALPGAFNPFLGRALVVACFLGFYVASYTSRPVADRLPDALALCCAIATAHYFWLLEHNHADPNWLIGSYIIITAVCAVLQTAKSLLAYSIFTALASVVVLIRNPALSFVVFMPGTLTILLFANIGLRSRLELVRQLEESHRRIESLFDAGFEGVVVEEHGIIREVNGACSRLAGATRDELIGRRTAEILPTAADDTAKAPELIRSDGTRVAIELSIEQHVLNGRPMRLLAIRDLTAQKRAEAALLLAHRELESFSYTVAHDLRAPLRGIDGFSQILVEDYADRLDATARAHLQSIRAGAQRMGELIDDLLELARVSRAELSRQRLDLSELATRIIDELRRQQPARHVTIAIEQGITVDADGQLLRILLENLIGNAWKFTAKTPAARIEVAVRTTAEGTVYSVRDNGAGFDMAFADKLFTPFHRLHRDDEFPGTGIGLATVQRIAQRHGGRVWVEAKVDAGATFHFTLAPPSSPPARRA